MIGIVKDNCDEEQDIPVWDILGVLPRTLRLGKLIAQTSEKSDEKSKKISDKLRSIFG